LPRPSAPDFIGVRRAGRELAVSGLLFGCPRTAIALPRDISWWVKNLIEDCKD